MWKKRKCEREAVARNVTAALPAAFFKRLREGTAIRRTIAQAFKKVKPKRITNA